MSGTETFEPSSKKAFGALSIRWRLLLLVFVPVGVLSLLVSSYAYRDKIDSVRSDTFEQTLAITRSLQRDFERITVMGSRDASVEASERLRSFRNIEYGVLYDRGGDGVWAYRRSDLAAIEPPAFGGERAAFDGDQVIVSRQLANRNGVFGGVWIQVSVPGWSHARRQAVVMASLTALALLVSALFLGALLDRHFSRPVLELVGFVRGFTERGRYERRVEPPDRAELGDLARGINHMLDRIAEERQEIISLNRALRRQIEARSRELEEALVSRGWLAGELGVGEVFADRYRIISVLGSGGAGVVYRVERVADGKILALKLLKPTVDPVALARFAREARILARLDHPHVVSIHDVGAFQGAFYLVMERLHGDSLRALEASHGDVPWVLHVLVQVADGLCAIHAEGIVHRDLKLSNIVVDSRGETPIARIVDFGIASDGVSLRTDDPGQSDLATATMPSISTPSITSQVGLVAGTPIYMAPERLQPGTTTTSAADIFSFGVIAYRLLVQRLPFDEPPIVIYQQRGTLPIPESLAESCPGVSLELADLLAASVHADPCERPTARELRDGLERALARLPLPGSRPGRERPGSA